MTVSEYAQNLLANFPADAEVLVKDTGCSCCVARGRYYVAGKPRIVLPVSSEYDSTVPPEVEEDGYSDAITNMVRRDMKEESFTTPKVAI